MARLTLFAFAVLAMVAAVAIVVISTNDSSAGSQLLQGDADCDEDVDVFDAAMDLRHAAGIGGTAGCTEQTGDVDCGGSIGARDAVAILVYVQDLPALSTPEACPAIGAVLPTGSPAPTPTSPQTSTPGPPTPTPTPQGTPVAGAYSLVQQLPSANFDAMVDFAVLPGTSGTEAVIITQPGMLYRVSLNNSFAVAAFGDLTGRVNCCGEQGLLSLAFSPNYAQDHRLYLYFTSTQCNVDFNQCSYLSRFTVNANDLDESSESLILEVGQPYTNHNGGRLLFGPDGYLYLSLGDGGSGGDPQDNGQNINALLGKLLRIDVSGDSGYLVPPDNPFVGRDGADEIYAYGLRNSWRYSFDRLTGALWLGDVGQSAWEEVDVIVKGGNYGWRCYEGFAAYNLSGCPASGFQFPVAVYDHPGGNCSITGGYVYRGAALPELYGWYVYADFCSGRVWALNATGESQPVLLLDSPYSIPHIAELPDGELLFLTFDNAVYGLARP